jgi:hypothetical protein
MFDITKGHQALLQGKKIQTISNNYQTSQKTFKNKICLLA